MLCLVNIHEQVHLSVLLSTAQYVPWQRGVSPQTPNDSMPRILEGIFSSAPPVTLDPGFTTLIYIMERMRRASIRVVSFFYLSLRFARSALLISTTR